MTLTVNLAPDVYDLTSAYAGAKGINLSEAIGELVRRAEQVPAPEPELELEQSAPSSRLKMNEHGYLVMARTGHVLTPEMVKEASEDELI